MSMITQSQLKKILSYNEYTGLFTWLVDKPKSHIFKAGRIASCLDVHGYIQINIRGNVMKGHRLAWLYMTGEFPNGQIDHINHVRNDNRWCNLRVVDNEGNHRNRPKQKNNKTGVVGVCFVNAVGKYLATIWVNKKQVRLGYFKELEDAKAARLEANKKYGYSENHGIGLGTPKYKDYR